LRIVERALDTQQERKKGDNKKDDGSEEEGSLTVP